jgi:hypothetical protein
MIPYGTWYKGRISEAPVGEAGCQPGTGRLGDPALPVLHGRLLEGSCLQLPEFANANQLSFTAYPGVASNAPPYADETMKPTSESLSPSEDTL